MPPEASRGISGVGGMLGVDPLTFILVLRRKSKFWDKAQIVSKLCKKISM